MVTTYPPPKWEFAIYRSLKSLIFSNESERSFPQHCILSSTTLQSRSLPLIPLKMWKIPSVFLLEKCSFLWVKFSIVSYKQEMRKSFCRETANKINILKHQKHWNLIHTWSEIGHCHLCMKGQLKLCLQSI